MKELTIQEKLDRLDKINANNRARSKKYLEKVKASGKKQVSAILSPEAFDELCRQRDARIQAGKPASYGDVFESLLLSTVNIDVTENSTVDVSINSDIDIKNIESVAAKDNVDTKTKTAKTIDIKENQLDIFDPEKPKDAVKNRVKVATKDNVNIDIPIDNTKTSNVPSLDDILLDLGAGTWPEKAKRLNDQGILTPKDRPWTADNLRMAVKKLTLKKEV